MLHTAACLVIFAIIFAISLSLYLLAENLKAALSFHCASLPSLSDTEEQIQHEPCTSSSSLDVQSPLTDTSQCEEEEEFRGEEGVEAQALNLSTAAQLQVIEY